MAVYTQHTETHPLANTLYILLQCIEALIYTWTLKKHFTHRGLADTRTVGQVGYCLIISILEIQLQIVFYPGYTQQMKYCICSSTSFRRKESIYYRTSLMIMYYIASLAKFGNCCSTVWACRQDQWEDNNYSLSF